MKANSVSNLSLSMSTSSGTDSNYPKLNNNNNADMNVSSPTSGQRWYVIFLQVLLPFFIAGFGMVRINSNCKILFYTYISSLLDFSSMSRNY